MFEYDVTLTVKIKYVLRPSLNYREVYLILAIFSDIGFLHIFYEDIHQIRIGFVFAHVLPEYKNKLNMNSSECII